LRGAQCGASVCVRVEGAVFDASPVGSRPDRVLRTEDFSRN
jgi:hypothetical protein